MSASVREIFPDEPTAELPVVGENVARSDELPPLTPAEQRFLEAVTFPGELQEDWSRRFDEAIETEVSGYINPQDQELVRKVASAMRWEWFADAGDPLPDGVALDDHGRLEFVDPSVQRFDYSVSTHIYSLLAEVIKERTEYFDVHMESHACDASAMVVRETPAYALLRALASDTLAQNDAPLTLAQRQIRETQEEELIRKRYGLTRDESLRIYPDVHHALQRRIAWLDEERQPKQASQETNPRKRLLSFIVSELNAYIENEEDGDTDAIVKLHDLPSTSSGFFGAHREGVIAERESGREMNVDDYLFYTSDAWVHQPEINGDRRLDGVDGSSMILYRLASKLLDPDLRSHSALELLEQVVRADEYEYYMGSGGSPISPGVKAYLHQMDLPVIKERYVPSVSWAPRVSERDYVNVVSAGAMEESARQVLGRVEGDAADQAAGRLVMASRHLGAHLPERTDDYSLMLRVGQERGEIIPLLGGYSTVESLGCINMDELEPYIPGYEVVAGDYEAGEWYFREAAGDPYEGAAEVAIHEADKNNLTQRLHALGMKALAEELSGLGGINLAQLVSVVRDYSDYTYDTQYRIPSYQKTEYTEDDFRQLIDGSGRLQVQCTGAATFLKWVLETALPEAQVGTVTGHTIGSHGVISEMGHVQLMVSHRGSQYVVDSTPPSRVAGRGGLSLSGVRNGEEARSARRASVRRDTPNSQDDATTATVEYLPSSLESMRAERRQRAETVVERTKGLLRSHFKLPSNATDAILYERIVGLKKEADPLRRVLELVLRGDNSQLGLDELERERKYLQGLQSAPPATLRRIGIPRYDETLLLTLARTVEDLKLKNTASHP